MILATVSALINVLFNCVLLVNKEVTNIKNILVSAAVIMWVLRFNNKFVQKFTQEWIVETSVYDGYFVRSVELVIATVVLIRLFNFSETKECNFKRERTCGSGAVKMAKIKYFQF